MSHSAATAVQAGVLCEFITRAFVAVDMPASDAATVAALMTEADLQGSDGHGVIRLAPHIKRIKAGGINLRPDIRVIEERAATALMDGDNGMGHWSWHARRSWPLPRRGRRASAGSAPD